jgi:3-phosphoshikimate 1-carboxyvinyltransferase
VSGGSDALDWIASAGSPLRGTLDIPGDKSVSHRSIMLAALADGVSTIEGFLEGEDTRATAAIFARLGVRIETPSPSRRIVHGVGIDGLRAADGVLDCGNAGTGMRLLAGLLAGSASTACWLAMPRCPATDAAGDRPLGARWVRASTPKRADCRHCGSMAAALVGIDHTLEVASAQVKSALLLAGLYADGETIVREPHPPATTPSACCPRSASHRVLARVRALARRATPARDRHRGAGGFFVGRVFPGGRRHRARFGIALEAGRLNPRRTGLLQALRMMGADIVEDNGGVQGGEPVADLRRPIRAAARHRGAGDIGADMIDEFPALFVAAAHASGPTVVRGAAELRVKESDRLAAMARGLVALGVRVEERADGAVIHGGPMAAGQVESAGDHRIAMAFCVAGLVASGGVIIEDCANVATSFPGFVELANGCGFAIR